MFNVYNRPREKKRIFVAANEKLSSVEYIRNKDIMNISGRFYIWGFLGTQLENQVENNNFFLKLLSGSIVWKGIF